MISRQNEYGETIDYDGEWFYHSDAGKIKLIFNPFVGISCINDDDKGVILNEEEYLIMLKLKLESGE